MRPRLAGPLVLALLAAGCGEPETPAPLDELAAIRGAGLCGRVEEALTRITPVLAAHPHDAAAAHLAGEIDTWRGLPESGVRWFRRATELAPSDPLPHYSVAYVLLVHPTGAAEDIATALAAAEAGRAAEGGRESADYCACRGEIEWLADRREDAARWFERALAEAPECRWALQRLLQISAAAGDDAARASYLARLTAASEKVHRGEGMSTGRSPVSFCGD